MAGWSKIAAVLVVVVVVVAAVGVYVVTGDEDDQEDLGSQESTVYYPDHDYEYTDDDGLYWGYWLGSMDSPGMSDAKTPVSESELVEIWRIETPDISSSVWKSPGSAVCVGDSTYFYNLSDSTLYRVITATGEVVASAYCYSGSVYNMALAYGDGKIFVPAVSGGYTTIVAFDAETLEQLFTCAPVSGGQVQGSITYWDGKVYIGTYDGDYACFSSEDLDPDSPDEVSAPLWTIETVGWYNATPAFFGDMCVVVEKGYDIGGAVAYLVDTDTGAIVDTISFDYEYAVAGAVAYDGRVYIAMNAVTDLSQAGDSSAAKTMTIHSFVVTDDGFDESSERVWRSDVENGGTQSIPVIWNDRIYICGGGSTMGSSEPFTVIQIGEDDEMETYCTLDITSKSTVSFTTAYATEENGYAIYIYIIEYGHVYEGEEWDSTYGYADIFVIRDSELQDGAEIVYSFTPSVPQFAYQSFTISPDGYLLIRNDVALFCYGFAETPEYGAEDLEAAIDLAIHMSEEGTVTNGQVRMILARYDALSDSERSQVSNWEEFEGMMHTVTVNIGDETILLDVFRGTVVDLPWYETPEGYEVVGWTSGGEDWTIYADRVYGDVTLDAVLASTVTITFDSAGGTAVPDVETVAGEVLPYVYPPERDGYTFAGWFSGGTEYVPQESTVAGDLSLTASWLKDSTISFDSAGGSSASPIDVTEGLAVGELPTPTRVGYAFDGWYYEGTLFTEDTVYPYDHDITLTASWVENDAITVSNGNGIEVEGVFSADTTISTSQMASVSSTARAIQAAVEADTGGTADCVLITIVGSGIDTSETVTVTAAVGDGLDGETLTVYAYVSGEVTTTQATVEDGHITFEVQGAATSNGMQISFGLVSGTEILQHV